MSVVASALRFLVAELGALAAFVWWGIDVGGWGIVVGVAALVVVVVLWALFVAPRAPRRVDDPARLVLELVIFAAATAALVGAGQIVVGVVYAVVAVATAAAARVWPEPVP